MRKGLARKLRSESFPVKPQTGRFQSVCKQYAQPVGPMFPRVWNVWKQVGQTFTSDQLIGFMSDIKTDRLQFGQRRRLPSDSDTGNAQFRLCVMPETYCFVPVTLHVLSVRKSYKLCDLAAAVCDRIRHIEDLRAVWLNTRRNGKGAFFVSF